MDRLLLTMGDSLEQLPRYPVVTLRVLAPQQMWKRHPSPRPHGRARQAERLLSFGACLRSSRAFLLRFTCRLVAVISSRRTSYLPPWFGLLNFLFLLK